MTGRGHARTHRSGIWSWLSYLLPWLRPVEAIDDPALSDPAGDVDTTPRPGRSTRRKAKP